MSIPRMVQNEEACFLNKFFVCFTELERAINQFN